MRDPDDPTHAGQDQGGVSIDELADLQAGLLTSRESAALRARIDADPHAARLLAALEQTVVELGELPDEPIPDDVAARIDAALQTEIAAAAGDGAGSAASRSTGPVPDGGGPDAAVLDLAAARAQPRTPRSDRRRAGAGVPRRWLGPVLALGAAAAVVAVVAGGVLSGLRAPDPRAGSAPVAPSLTAAQLPTLWPGIRESRDLSFLDAPGKVEECVGPVDTFADPSTVLGARPVVVDGQYGVAVAVPVSPVASPGGVLLVVVGPACAGVGGDVIAQTFIPN